MTAPARATSPATPAKALRESTKPKPAPEKPTALRSRSTASERAYARKAERRDRWLRVVPQRRIVSGRAPFVLLVMALLACGLVATLWLTTAATMGSYELERDRKASRDLAEQVEQLKIKVAEAGSPAKLEQKAKELGLVPAGNPARLVPKPDGTVDVNGDPAPAKAPPAPQPQQGQPQQGQPQQGQPQQGQQQPGQQQPGQQGQQGQNAAPAAGGGG